MQETELREAKEDIISMESYISSSGIDVDDAKILKFTHKNPRTIPTLCSALGIPVAECHRRTKRLSAVGLLKRIRLSSAISTSEKRGRVFYTANTDKVEVITVNNKTHVRLKKVGVPDGSMFQFA